MVDIQWNTLLGECVHKVVRPNARRLASKLPKVRKKYTEILTKHMRRHRVLPRLQHIFQHARQTLTAAQGAELTLLDKTKQEGMLYAERNCRSLRMGEVDGSPIVYAARRLVELWRAVLKRRSGRKASSSWIKKRARKCGILCPLSVTKDQAMDNLTAAIAEYRKLKPKAPELRQHYLRDQTKNKNLKDKDRAEARRMLRDERSRETSRFLRRMLGRTQGGSVSKVEYTSAAGITTIKETEKEVIDVIMENNEAWFRLTENTPLMQPDFVDDLGYLGCTAAAERILEGTYVCPPNTDEYTRTFIEALRATTHDIHQQGGLPALLEESTGANILILLRNTLRTLDSCHRR